MMCERGVTECKKWVDEERDSSSDESGIAGSRKEIISDPSVMWDP